MNNFDVFSLNQIKSKVNYEKAVIMIDDINLSERT